jgi:hypothetical protein
MTRLLAPPMSADGVLDLLSVLKLHVVKTRTLLLLGQVPALRNSRARLHHRLCAHATFHHNGCGRCFQFVRRVVDYSRQTIVFTLTAMIFHPDKVFLPCI